MGQGSGSQQHGGARGVFWSQSWRRGKRRCRWSRDETERERAAAATETARSAMGSGPCAVVRSVGAGQQGGVQASSCRRRSVCTACFICAQSCTQGPCPAAQVSEARVHTPYQTVNSLSVLISLICFH